MQKEIEKKKGGGRGKEEEVVRAARTWKEVGGRKVDKGWLGG